MAYLFRPPTTDGGVIGWHRIFRFYRPHQSGISVLVTNGVVTQQQSPSDLQIAAADAVYLGGHEYVISDAEAAPLLAAGIGGLVDADLYIDVYEENH